jgi:hypothetical protein
VATWHHAWSSKEQPQLCKPYSLFGWLVADGWSWFVVREEHCWLVAGGWFVVREKYCWLVADKPSEQGVSFMLFFIFFHKQSCASCIRL